MRGTKVTIELTNDQALVLFEVLQWLEDAGPFADQAEQRVLWDMQCVLERQLAEILSPNYGQLLDEARQRVRDSEG